MKRLLLINDFESAGGAEEVFKLTRELISGSFIVKTLTGAGSHIKPACALSYVYPPRNLAGFLSRIYSVKNYRRTLDALTGFRPDIVHLHNYYSSLSPSVLGAIRAYRRSGGSVRVVYTAHDFHLLCPLSSFTHYSFFSRQMKRLDRAPDALKVLFYNWDSRGFPFSLVKKLQWVYAYMGRRLDSEIDRIITPSEFLARFYKEKYSSVPVTVIRNPVEGIEAVNGAGNQGKGAAAGKTGRIFKMVFAGRLSPEKGLKEFIECLSGIDNIRYAFKIIGTGPQKDELERMIEERGLRDKVTMAGRLSHKQVLEELKRHDALVLPSLCPESAPLSLVEGAFMNLRLITADYGGMKELAGMCGGQYLLRPTDARSVRGSLERCYMDAIAGGPIKGRDITALRSAFGGQGYLRRLLEVYNS